MQVVSLLATVVEHLVTGETMQMATTSDQRCRYIISVVVSAYEHSLSSNLDIYFLLLSTELTSYLLVSHYCPINANNVNLVLKGFLLCGYTAWNIICRRHTTRQLHWFQTAARLLLSLQDKLQKFHCLLITMVETWFVLLVPTSSTVCFLFCWGWNSVLSWWCFWSSQGLAYQLIDDVLDFTGTSSSLGKGSLSDIRHVMCSDFALFFV